MARHESDVREGRGRSAQKRAAKAIEDLARQLVELPNSMLTQLPLSPDLRRELEAARTTRGHSARRRQLKYLAGCLRRDDESRQLIAARLEQHQAEQVRQQHAFRHLEALRDRLCDPQRSAQALEELRSLLADSELEKIAGLARAAQTTGDKHAAREIFRRLRDAPRPVLPDDGG